MLYALGGPDGTGKSNILLVLVDFLDYSSFGTHNFLFYSANHGLPSSLNLIASDIDDNK